VKITKQRLKEIIKEELERVSLLEASPGAASIQQSIQKITRDNHSRLRAFLAIMNVAGLSKLAVGLLTVLKVDRSSLGKPADLKSLPADVRALAEIPSDTLNNMVKELMRIYVKQPDLIISREEEGFRTKVNKLGGELRQQTTGGEKALKKGDPAPFDGMLTPMRARSEELEESSQSGGSPPSKEAEKLDPSAHQWSSKGRKKAASKKRRSVEKQRIKKGKA